MGSTPGEAVRALRARAAGDCVWGEPPWDTRREAVRFVIDRRRGGLLLRASREVGEAGSLQLMLPDEHDPAIALQLAVETVEAPPGDVEIRFEVYHGAGVEGVWVVAEIEAANYHGETFDRDELELVDLVVGDEPRLCRELNAQPELVRAACERVGATVESPVVVGVDPDGIDVRARFGIVRLEFPETASSVEAVRDHVERLTRERA